MGTQEKPLVLWADFCSRERIAELAVPLFDCDQLHVNTFPFGNNRRILLKRSQEMDSLVIGEVEKVLHDYETGRNEYEGIIYMMLWPGAGQEVAPLYIGKSEKFGRGEGNLSANIASISSNNGKFCRWGYNYAYHVGDLSAVVCSGHPQERQTPKYQRWAAALFDEYPSDKPKLKRPVHFWAKAWKRGDIGPWTEFGETSLTLVEYLLIGLASKVAPNYILNDEGVNRG